ncbi:MAG: Rrf2 family transcriptional regulator [Planctomycetes bacterium]|nr:Rrf2 family transcriptional regulator [Planctomycetota bacterium]
MRGSLFSAKAEYACLAMLELAARHGDQAPVRLKAIADANGIPKRFLVQILLQLKGAGLVASTRGASGGYHLARAPDKISLADIIGIIDHSENPTEMRSGGGSPLSPLARSIHTVWNSIQDAQQRILDSTNLAELLQRAQSVYDLVYQI